MKPPARQTSLAKARPAAASAAPGAVRIIGGAWKRSKLPVLAKPGLRPTPDRVRETLFNWLGQDLNGIRCVDAFAGSGALGFEAASRGAQTVLMIEQEPQLVAQLNAQKTRLKADAIHVQRGDGIAGLKNLSRASVDLIFLDPPFDSGLYDLALSAASPALSQQGAIYLEAPESWSDQRLEPLGLYIVKQGKAGTVHFYLLRRGSAV